MSDLQTARATLCDLLIGRHLRLMACQHLDAALYLEHTWGPERLLIPREIIDDLMGQAAHWEWIATQAELGQVRWGGRLNRCGYQPREDVE